MPTFNVSFTSPGVSVSKAYATQEHADGLVQNFIIEVESSTVFSFYSELDTTSGVSLIRGSKNFTEIHTSNNLVGVSYNAKLAASSSYTTLADLTALNNWIVSNVTSETILWQLRLVADYGTNSGDAQALLIDTKNIELS